MGTSAQQIAFISGEWSKAAQLRTDRPNHGGACSTMRNFYPVPQGPASNRQGLLHITKLKDSTKVGRVFDFTFSVTQGYALIFGDQTLRFIMNGGLIVIPKTVTGAADDGSGGIRLTVPGHAFLTGVSLIVSGILGTTEANGEWVITVADANHIDLIGAAFLNAYVSGGSASAIVEIATPYIAADLALLKFEQSADTLYIRHPSYDRRKLTRTSHYDWTLSVITAGASMTAPGAVAASGGSGHTYVVTSALADGTESIASPVSDASAAGNTLSWSAVVSPVPDLYKVYELVNGLPQFVGQTNTTSFLIPSSAPDVNQAAPVDKNPFPGADDFPGCCAFFDQRLYEARTNNKPQTFNGSVIGDFENSNISTPVKDDDAFEFTLNSNQVNEIKWMLSVNNLVIGTSGAEWIISPGANSSSVTATSIQAIRQSQWGSSDIRPLVIGHDVIFVEASGRKVRDLFYSIVVGGVNGGYDANDVTVLAQHLFENYGITAWAYQQHPDSVVWCIREDGVMLGLTFLKEHQIYAWHRHDTQGTFESVCVVGNIDGTKDVYFIVKRTIGGAITRFVEKLATRTFADVEDAFFVDCGATFDGSVSQTLTPGAGATTIGQTGVFFTVGDPVFVPGDVGREIHYRWAEYETTPANTATPPRSDPDAVPIWHTAIAVITGYSSTSVVQCTIQNAFPSTDLIPSGAWRMSSTVVSGLDHLEGATVSCLANGGVFQDLVVTDGAVTFPAPISKAQIGLSYTCDLETVSFDYPTKTGSVQSKIRNIIAVVLALDKTRGGWVGPDAQHLYEIPSRTDESQAEPTNLFSGKTQPISIDPAEDQRAGKIFIRQTDPLPITVTAIYPNIDDAS